MKCKLRLGMPVSDGELSPCALESNLYVSPVPKICMCYLLNN